MIPAARFKKSHFLSTAIAAAVALGPVQSSAGSDAIAGALVGAIIGGAIVDQAHRNRKPAATARRTTTPRATTSTSQRTANREVQGALNYFGYNVGTPDGAIGPKTRTGISQYQVLMGYAPTGQLTDFERTILVTAHQRALAGGPAIMQTLASHPQGARGLLFMQRDEMVGAPGQGGGTVMAATPAVPVTPVVPEVTAPAGPALPNFFGGAVMAASLASHCNKVSLLTNTNGGFVTAASMTDPTFALSEQFCLARTYAMSQAEELMTRMPGTNARQVTEQCASLGPALADQVAALSLRDRDAVLQSVSGFVLGAGMPPAQLGATARVCLGAGYTTDDMDVAIASALLLTALGERGYAELLGHHLSQGFGASQRVDLALPWYEMGLDSVSPGATMVFAPGMPDRAGLIRKAVHTLGGKGDNAALAPAAPVPAALPGFAAPMIGAAPPAITPDAGRPEAVTRTGVDALPLPARLPFLLFRD